MSLVSVSNPAKKKVVIVGMGPGGLAAAIQLARQGHEVSIIENRDKFTRGQKLGLYHSVRKYLWDVSKEIIDARFPLPRDASGAPLLRDKGSEAAYQQALTDREIFFKQKVKEDFVSIADVQTFLLDLLKLIPENVNIMQGPEYQVGKFDLKNKKKVIAVKKGLVTQRLEFDLFVAADGARRAMNHKFNEALSEVGEFEKRIKYRYFHHQTRVESHGAINLKIKGPIRKREFVLDDLDKLKAQGWHYPYFPNINSYVGHDRELWYYSSEIPDSILAIQDEQERTKKLVDWFKLIGELRYSAKPENISLDLSSGKMAATAFYVNQSFTDTPLCQLDDAVYCSIGDSTMTPNHEFAHGLNHAIKEALDLAEAAQKAEMMGSFDSQEFIEKIKEIEQSIQLLLHAKYDSNISAQQEVAEEIKQAIIKYGLKLVAVGKEMEKQVAVLPQNFKRLRLNFAKALARQSDITDEERSELESELKAEAELAAQAQVEAAPPLPPLDQLFQSSQPYLEALLMLEQAAIQNLQKQLQAELLKQPVPRVTLLAEQFFGPLTSALQKRTEIMLSQSADPQLKRIKSLREQIAEKLRNIEDISKLQRRKADLKASELMKKERILTTPLEDPKARLSQILALVKKCESLNPENILENALFRNLIHDVIYEDAVIDQIKQAVSNKDVASQVEYYVNTIKLMIANVNRLLMPQLPLMPDQEAAIVQGVKDININFIFDQHESLLIKLIKIKKVKLVKELLKLKYLDCTIQNKQGKNALMMAIVIMPKKKNLILELIERSNIHALDERKNNVLAYAIFKNANPAIIDAIMSKMNKADLNQVNVDGYTPLNLAIWYQPDNHKLLSSLLLNTTNINRVNKKGESLLAIAIDAYQKATGANKASLLLFIKELLNRDDVDVNLTTSYGKNALDLARSAGIDQDVIERIQNKLHYKRAHRKLGEEDAQLVKNNQSLLNDDDRKKVEWIRDYVAAIQTEYQRTNDKNVAAEKLAQLKERGFKIEVDDDFNLTKIKYNQKVGPRLSVVFANKDGAIKPFILYEGKDRRPIDIFKVASPNEQDKFVYQQIDHILGQGMFGRVKFAQEYDHPHSLKAVKVITSASSAKEEADILKKMGNLDAELVRKKKDGVIKHYLFQNLNYGENAEEYLEQCTVADCLAYFKQIAEQIQALHSKGILHRDITLRNMLFDPAAKKSILVDYGHAIALRPGEVNRVINDRTSGAMAPEVESSGTYSKKSDVFAFGKIIEETLGFLVTEQMMQTIEPRHQRYLEHFKSSIQQMVLESAEGSGSRVASFDPMVAAINDMLINLKDHAILQGKVPKPAVPLSSYGVAILMKR